jgi:hypothetical protein
MRSSHANQASRSGPGANRSQIARRTVTSAAALICLSSMGPASYSRRPASLVSFGCDCAETRAFRVLPSHPWQRGAETKPAWAFSSSLRCS